MADEKANQLEENLDPRDHRVLGRELDLFTFSDTVGKGLPLWTARERLSGGNWKDLLSIRNWPGAISM